MNIFKVIWNAAKIKEVLEKLYSAISKANEVLKTIKIPKYQDQIDNLVKINEKILTVLAAIIKILGGTIEQPVVSAKSVKLDDVLADLDKIKI